MTQAWADTIARDKARKRRARRIALLVAAGIVAAVVAVVTIGPVVARLTTPPTPPTPVVHPGNRTPSGEELLTLPTAGDPALSDVWSDWSYDLEEGPVVLDDAWVLTADDGESSLSAVELKTGETKWTLSGADVTALYDSLRERRSFLHLHPLHSATPLVVATTAAGISDDRVVAIDGATGVLVWQSETGARYLGDFVDDDGSFLVAYAQKDLRTSIQKISLSASDPVMWETIVNGDVVIRGDRVFVFGATPQVLDASEGTPLDSWSEECFSTTRDGAGTRAPTLVGELLVSYRNDGRVRACDANGRELWSSGASAWWPILDHWERDAERPVATSQLLVARTEGSTASLTVLDMADGAELELALAGSKLPSIDTVLRSGEHFITAAEQHTDSTSLTVFDARTGARLWDATGSYLRTVSRTGITALRAGDEPDGSGDTVVGLALDDGEQLWETSWGDDVPYYLGTRAFLWGANGVYTPLTTSD
jgi:outer membrane protein assembly factor BamB